MSWAEDDGYDAYDASDFNRAGINSNPKVDRLDANWVTKDGHVLRVTEMENDHLFNAYMISGKDSLFKEMVYRLFEAKLKDKNT